MNDTPDLVPEENVPAGDPVTALIERCARNRTETSPEATDVEVNSICSELMAGKEFSEKEKAVLPMMVKTLLNLRLKELRSGKE